MGSTIKMEYQVFLCIFQKNSAMATLGLKQIGKFLWEGREKSLPCWLPQFSFPISFKPKVTINGCFWKMQRKTWYSIFRMDAMPLSLENLLLSGVFHVCCIRKQRYMRVLCFASFYAQRLEQSDKYLWRLHYIHYQKLANHFFPIVFLD